MKKQTTILLSMLVFLTGVPVQSDASFFSGVKETVARIADKVDNAFHSVKEKVSDAAATVKDKTSDAVVTVKEKTSDVAHEVKEKTTNAVSTVKESVTRTTSKISQKVGDAVSTVKEKTGNVVDAIKEKASNASDKVAAAATATKEATVSTATGAKNAVEKTTDKIKEKVSYTKERVSMAYHEVLDKARSTMQDAFNMNFLSSVPVIFWKDTFDRMTKHAQDSVDNINLEYNGEVVTRDDFQDDKALHIKKSAELALHIKSLFGSSVLAYGVTLAVGGMKELIDGSFLNPNGGRCWEDFYADIVGASAVFGEKAFDKKLNKYMDSFLKENRTINPIEEIANIDSGAVSVAASVENVEPEIEADVEELPEVEYTEEADVEMIDKTQLKQELTKQYYNAIENGDTEAAKTIAEQIRSL